MNLFDMTHLQTPAVENDSGLHDGVPDLDSYDRFVVFFSGGKDSICCVLHLLDLGVPKHKIELHHHCVDGAPGEVGLMDWPVTHSYVEAFAAEFGLALYFSYRIGGIEREANRVEAPTAPVRFMRGDGQWGQIGGTDKSPLGTRRKFPAVSADLRVRWCSSVCKISIADALLRNDERFRHSRTLVLTGERAQESANRARYAQFEPHRSDARAGRLGRHIDHWRPVHQWFEEQVWALIERYRVNPHPAYRTGVGINRASCLFCIFANKHQWATSRNLAPGQFYRIAQMERDFDHTIHHTKSVVELADSGTAYVAEPGWEAIAMSSIYNAPIVDPNWTLPIGAFGDGSTCGPT